MADSTGGAYAGEIRVRSRIDTSELTSDTAKLQAQMDKVVHKMQETSTASKHLGLEQAFQKAQETTRGYEAELEKVRAKLEELRNTPAVDEQLQKQTRTAETLYAQAAERYAAVAAKFEQMSSRSVGYNDVKAQMEQYAAALSIQEQALAKAQAAEQAYTAQRQADIEKLTAQEQTLTDKVAEAKGREQLAEEKVAEARNVQKHRLEELNAEYERLGMKLDETKAKEDASTQSAQKSATQIAKKTRDIGSAASSSGNAFAQLGKRIGNLVKSVFIFSIISKALQQIKAFLQNVASSIPELAQAFGEIRGALLTAFQPIWETIQPLVVGFFQWLAKALKVVAALISRIFGKSLVESANNAKQLYTQMNSVSTATNKATKSIKKADKAVRSLNKSLAGFDEITQLSDNGDLANGLIGDIGDIGGSGDVDVAPIATGPIFPNSEEDQAFMDKVDEFINSLLNSPIFQRISEAWKKLTAGWGEFKIAWDKFFGGNGDGTATVQAMSSAVGGILSSLSIRIEGEIESWGLLLSATAKAMEGDWEGAAEDMGDLTVTMVTTPIATQTAVADALFDSHLTKGVLALKDALQESGLDMSEWTDQQKGAIYNAIRDIYKIYVAIVNPIRTVMNKLIRGLNSIQIKLPPWVCDLLGLPHGSTFGFHLKELDMITVPPFYVPTGSGMISHSGAHGHQEGFRGGGVGDIPALARGAVIPPNAPFMAMLGDQTHGTNIEAPLDTLVEAFRQAQGSQGVTIEFKGSLAQLGRVLQPVITNETKRLGPQFVTVGGFSAS